jgi:protein-tyrosine phosphatase
VNLDATAVFGNLWIGAEPPPDLKMLCPWQVVVFAAKEIQPRYLGRTDKLLIYAPLRDAVISSQEKQIAAEAGAEIAHLLTLEAKVLVTCAAGLNRSALIAALAMVTLGVSPEDAMAEIRAARGAGALSNPSFVKFLRSERTK